MTTPTESAPSRRALVLSAALVAAAGVFHALSWVIPGWWPGAWIGQALLILFAVQATPRGALFGGWLVGCIGLGWAFSWAPACLAETLDAGFFAAHGLYALLVAWEALLIGGFAWATCRLSRRGWLAFCAAPLVYAALEHWTPRIFPWMLGYTQIPNPALLQVAAIGGSGAIGALLTFVASAPAAWWVHQRHDHGDLRPLVTYLFVIMAVLVAWLQTGQTTILAIESRLQNEKTPPYRIAIAQVDIGMKDSEKKLLELTRDLSHHVDLVVWPESSIGYYHVDLPDFRDRDRVVQNSFQSFEALRPCPDFGCDLIVGCRTFEDGATEDGPFYMTALLVDKEERIVGHYHKRTLLPFGEYMPFEDQFPFLHELATLRTVTRPGRTAAPLVTSQGRKVGVVICYEDMILSNVRQTAAQGAELLVSIINGTAFTNPLTLDQHHRLAFLRAIEHRRYFVRVAATGVTSVISPTGKTVCELPQATDQATTCEVRLIAEPSLYTRWGEWFPWLATIVGAAAMGTTVKRGGESHAERA